MSSRRRTRRLLFPRTPSELSRADQGWAEFLFLLPSGKGGARAPDEDRCRQPLVHSSPFVATLYPAPSPAGIGGKEAGFTLVEMMVAVAVFAVIGLAGFTILDGILRAREVTEGRLERLARMQRVMYLLSSDLEQTAPGPLVAGGTAITFRRHAAGEGGGDLPVRYDLEGDTLRRSVGGAPPQRLLSQVASVRWTVLSREGAWSAPPLPSDAAAPRPRAVAVDIELAADAEPPTGTLRRVVELPAAP